VHESNNVKATRQAKDVTLSTIGALHKVSTASRKPASVFGQSSAATGQVATLSRTLSEQLHVSRYFNMCIRVY